MDITPLIPKNRNLINSYGPLGFEINKIKYNNTIIIAPDQLLEVKIDSLAEIFEENLTNLLNQEPEIIIIGTGKEYMRISDQIKNKIKTHYPSASISEMATDAACRTYNILMSEDRNLIAILYQI